MSLPELKDEHRKVLQQVCSDFDAADKMRHKRFRERCEELYKLYRVYQDAKNWISDHPGIDVVPELKAEWGSDLHIPYSFSNVETIVPRMLSNRPKGLILPRDRDGAQNGGNMLLVLEAQQDQVHYPLRVQTTAKTGQIYGLGVRKSTWRKVERDTKRLVRATVPTDDLEWTTRPEKRVLHDDPWTEDVDPFDFIWDPFADSLETCEWVIHRTWRSLRYVWGKIRSGEWDLLCPKDEPAGRHMPDAYYVERADIEGLGSGEHYSTVWRERMQAAGHENFDGRGNQVHEVWEFHDGRQVITILDRTLPVKIRENPMWHGNMPFHIYRPSEVPHEFVGVGAIEPARFLQYEMDTLRSQRRDYAAIALSPVVAVQDGAVDTAHLQVYPGAVWNIAGDPRELIRKVDLGDVPQSGYAEEDRIRADIERATGLSDVVNGAGSASAGTATEAQLQLAAANVRIQNMTYRFEVEIIESEMDHWLELNQQMIRGSKGYAREVPTPGTPDRRYTWFEMEPPQLAGQMAYRVLGGSTQPDNVPQMRADAQMLMQTFGQDPTIDGRKLRMQALEQMGFKHPEALIMPDTMIPRETLNFMVKGMAQAAGVPAELTAQVAQVSLEAAEQQIAEAQGQQPTPAQEQPA